MNRSLVKSACSLTREQRRLALPGFLGIVRTGCCGRSGFVLWRLVLSTALSTFQHSGLWYRKRRLTGTFPANLHICKVI